MYMFLWSRDRPWDFLTHGHGMLAVGGSNPGGGTIVRGIPGAQKWQ